MSIHRKLNTVIHSATARTGKTFTLAKAAQEHGGVVICPSASAAQRVSREYGVEAVGVHSVERLLGGRFKPLIEPEVIVVLHQEYQELADEVEKLRNKCSMLELDVSRAQRISGVLELQLRRELSRPMKKPEGEG